MGIEVRELCNMPYSGWTDSSQKGWWLGKDVRAQWFPQLISKRPSGTRTIYKPREVKAWLFFILYFSFFVIFYFIFYYVHIDTLKSVTWGNHPEGVHWGEGRLREPHWAIRSLEVTLWLPFWKSANLRELSNLDLWKYLKVYKAFDIFLIEKTVGVW